MLFANNLVSNKIFTIALFVFTLLISDNSFAETSFLTNTSLKCKDKIFETNNYLDFVILKQKIYSLDLSKVANIVLNVEINLNITETSKVKLLNSLADIQQTLNPIINYVIEGFSSDNVEEFEIKAYKCNMVK